MNFSEASHHVIGCGKVFEQAVNEVLIDFVENTEVELAANLD